MRAGNEGLIVWALVGLLLCVPACGGDGGDHDDISWSARVSATETGGTSTGGVVVQAEGKTLANPTLWLLGEPAPFAAELGPVDLVSVGEAMYMARPEEEVVDAIVVPGGTAALLCDHQGNLELRLLGDPTGTAVPEQARRILLAGESPLRVVVVLGEDQAVAATYVR